MVGGALGSVDKRTRYRTVLGGMPCFMSRLSCRRREPDRNQLCPHLLGGGEKSARTPPVLLTYTQ